MGEKICLLCGKRNKNDDPFCDECQQMVKNELPEYLLKKENSERTSSQNVLSPKEESQECNIKNNEIDDPNFALLKQRELLLKKDRTGKNKSSVILIIGLILLITVGVISYLVIKDEKNSETIEIAFWNECITENTPLSYSKYLVRFPNGLFTQKAEDSILKLRKQEQNDWNNLQNTQNIDAYINFKMKYPESPFKNVIAKKIDSLAWIQTKSCNTDSAYLRYLQRVDSGLYAGEYAQIARESYNSLSSLIKVKGEALKTIKTNMSEFARFLSIKKYDNARKFVTPTMNNYLGKTNIETKNIIDDLKKYNKENKIKTINYSFGTDSLEVYRNKNGIFLFDITVIKQTKYIDKKKADEKAKFLLSIELDSMKQLQSVMLKQ